MKKLIFVLFLVLLAIPLTQVQAAPKECLIQAGQACTEYVNLKQDQKVALVKEFDAEAIVYKNFIWYLYQGKKYSWNLETNKIVVSSFENIKKQFLTAGFFVMLVENRDYSDEAVQYDFWSGDITGIDGDGLIGVEKSKTITEMVEKYFIVNNTIFYQTKSNTYRIEFISYGVSNFIIENSSYFDIFGEDLRKKESTQKIDSFMSGDFFDCGSANNDKNKDALLCFAKKLRDCQPATIKLDSKNFSSGIAKISQANGHCFVETSFSSVYYKDNTIGIKKCLYDNSHLAKKNDADLIKSTTGFLDKYIIYNGASVVNNNELCIDNGQMGTIVSNWYRGPFNCERQGSAVDDYYKAGRTTAYSMMDSLEVIKDGCYDDGYGGNMEYKDKADKMQRLTCDPKKSKDQSSIIINVPCPFGCEKGACLKTKLNRTQKIEKLNKFFSNYLPVKNILGDYFMAYFSGEGVGEKEFDYLFTYNLKTDKMDIINFPNEIESLKHLQVYNGKAYAVAVLKVGESGPGQVGLYQITLSSKSPFKQLKKFNGRFGPDNVIASKDNLIFMAINNEIISYDLKKNSLKTVYSLAKDKKISKDYEAYFLNLTLLDNTLFIGPYYNSGCGISGGDMYYLNPLSSGNARLIRPDYGLVDVSGGVNGRAWIKYQIQSSSTYVTAPFDTNKGLISKQTINSSDCTNKIQTIKIGYYQGKAVLVTEEYIGLGGEDDKCKYSSLSPRKINNIYLWDGFNKKQLMADNKTLPQSAIDYYYNEDTGIINLLSLTNNYQFDLAKKNLKTVTLPFTSNAKLFTNLDYLGFSGTGQIRFGEKDSQGNSKCYQVYDNNIELITENSAESWFDYSSCTESEMAGC